MNFDSKYNIHDTVLYLHSNGETGNVDVRGGLVKGITIKCIENLQTSIIYEVVVNVDYRDEDWIEIPEEFLFNDEKDVMKFFRKNMKVQLETVEAKRKRLEAVMRSEDLDDLPF